MHFHYIFSKARELCPLLVLPIIYIYICINYVYIYIHTYIHTYMSTYVWLIILLSLNVLDPSGSDSMMCACLSV
jgi:hypothetical protein